MSEPVVVFGTGSFAQVVRFYLTHDSPYDVVAFTASGEHIDGDSFDGLPLVPFEEVERRFPPATHRMFVAVGYAKLNRQRERFYGEAKAKGYELVSYVCSRGTHWGDTVLGDNCFIFEDVTIQPFVTVGNNVVMWSGNHIGHHSTIGDHCFLTSHVVVSGHVTVGSHCFLGVNATLRDSITVASGTVVGAGALIMKDTQEREVYAAAPTLPRDQDSGSVF